MTFVSFQFRPLRLLPAVNPGCAAVHASGPVTAPSRPRTHATRCCRGLDHHPVTVSSNRTKRDMGGYPCFLSWAFLVVSSLVATSPAFDACELTLAGVTARTEFLPLSYHRAHKNGIASRTRGGRNTCQFTSPMPS